MEHCFTAILYELDYRIRVFTRKESLLACIVMISKDTIISSDILLLVEIAKSGLTVMTENREDISRDLLNCFIISLK